MKYLLHIDTSGDTGFAGISRDGQLLSTQTSSESRNYAGSINLMIQASLELANITLRDLSGVVVCAGPGSYTGLRIGLSTAKGFCYALNIPLLLDNKLTLLANQAFSSKHVRDKNFGAVLLAREREYFVSIFDEQCINVFPAQHVLENELEEIFINKTNIYLVSECIPQVLVAKMAENMNINTNTQIDYNLWARYAFEQYQCNKTVNLSTSEPFYLKQVYTHK